MLGLFADSAGFRRRRKKAGTFVCGLSVKDRLRKLSRRQAHGKELHVPAAEVYQTILGSFSTQGRPNVSCLKTATPLAAYSGGSNREVASHSLVLKVPGQVLAVQMPGLQEIKLYS